MYKSLTRKRQCIRSQTRKSRSETGPPLSTLFSGEFQNVSSLGHRAVAGGDVYSGNDDLADNRDREKAQGQRQQAAVLQTHGE